MFLVGGEGEIRGSTYPLPRHTLPHPVRVVEVGVHGLLMMQ